MSIKKPDSVPQTFLVAAKGPGKLKRKKKTEVRSLANADRVKRVKIANRTTPTKKVKVAKYLVRKNQKKSTPSLISPVIRQKYELALLSPFRFPVDPSTLISQVARYSGVAFVMVGAFLAIFNLYAASGATLSFNNLQQLAQTGAPTYDCANTTSPNYDSVYCSSAGSSVDETPPVDFTLEGVSPLAALVPINVYVTSATNVVLKVRSQSDNTYTVLGTAQKIADSHWRFYWNTQLLNDGDYRLTAVITNTFGTYKEDYSDNLTIENFPVTSNNTNQQAIENISATSGSTNSTSSSSQTATTTNATNTSTTSTASPTVTLSVAESLPLKSYASIKVSAPGATGMKFFVAPGTTTAYGFVGNPIFHGDSEWRYEWDTTTIIDGTYSLMAQALFQGVSKQSLRTVVTVRNNPAEQPATAESNGGASTTAPGTTTVSNLELEPQIVLSIPKQNPLIGKNDIFVQAANLTFVEIYVIPKNSITQKYIGLASKMSGTQTWRYAWDTKNTPNGEYEVFARAKHAYGTSESKRYFVMVHNDTEPTYKEEESNRIEELKTINGELITTPIIESSESVFASDTPNTIVVQHPISILDDIDLEEGEKFAIKQLLESFRPKLEVELRQLSVAFRLNNDVEIRKIEKRIEDIRADIVRSLPLSDSRNDVVKLIDEHLRNIAAQLQDITIRNERIIKERTGNTVMKDTDRDGVTDYDEVNLYSTDPFNSDTDRDGFTDGTEIGSGFNPTDSSAESLLTYESPIETGVVRDDILSVDSIIGMSDEDAETATDVPQSKGALLMGRALPYSYVTLYVFSTPIVITVRADETGSWSYVFDKELEDGEHEVYAGMTDNAGRIVAKSNPFTFVKTAEAFTPVDAKEALGGTTIDVTPTLFDMRLLLALASVGVVSIGLSLILLGIHVSRRERATIQAA